MAVHQLNFGEMWHERVSTNGHSVIILDPNRSDSLTGSLRIEPGSQVIFVDLLVTIDADLLLGMVQKREALTQLSCEPQLAAYLFAITRKPLLMNHYFPITAVLNSDEEAEFHNLISRIAHHPSFGIHLIGEKRIDRTADLLPDAEYITAGHIAEIFFYRQDLLGSFLSHRRGFLLYTTPQAFKDDGGGAGGCYSPQRDAIQLVMSRLYEGFYAPTPGVAPFIHEFGHMLDHASGNRGLIPGMDGVIDLFRRGKRLDLSRYQQFHIGHGEIPPIGHPYVFQNNGEFIAGYLEMFFRNPHYFAAQNPDLYQAFAQCLVQDPRRYWNDDFPYYVQQNRDFYLKRGQQPPRPGITIP